MTDMCNNTLFDIVSDVQLSKVDSTVLKYILNPINPYLIVAGDVTRVENWDILVSFFAVACTNYRMVYYVPGNHEYYTGNPNLTMSVIELRLKKLEDLYSNLNILCDRYITYEKLGFVIFGGMLWSKLSDPHQPINRSIYMNNGEPINYSEWNRRHFTTVSALDEAISYASENNLKLYVVTHYAPTFKDTLSEKWNNHPHNVLYCTDMEYYFNKKIYAWVFGHTGHNCDKIVNGMRLVSNQCDVKEGKKFSKNVSV